MALVNSSYLTVAADGIAAGNCDLREYALVVVEFQCYKRRTWCTWDTPSYQGGKCLCSGVSYGACGYSALCPGCIHSPKTTVNKGVTLGVAAFLQV